MCFQILPLLTGSYHFCVFRKEAETSKDTRIPAGCNFNIGKLQMKLNFMHRSELYATTKCYQIFHW